MATDIVARLRVYDEQFCGTTVVSALCGEAADEIERLSEVVDELRATYDDWQGQWFYLHCHPEHAKAVADEVLFGVDTKRDGAGHVLG